MQSTLETLGQLERRLNVSVPIADIETEVQNRLHRMARTMKMPGFRPGKVPLRMVAQQYGPQVRSDVISEKVQSSFSEAVREQNLRVAGSPRIEPAQASKPESGTFDYAAVFEIYPDVTLGDLSQETIRRPVAEVTPADVDRTVETLRRQRVHYHTVDREAADGDRVVVDFTGTIDGVPFEGGQAKAYPIVLGERRMLPEFEAALPGSRAGERKEIDVHFPADYQGKDVAGKTARFALAIERVEEPHLPAVDADFAKSLGIDGGSVEALRREVETNLKLELKRKIDSRVKEQVMQALRRSSTLVVPRSLVDAESQGLAQRAYNEMRQAGAKPEDIKIDAEVFRPQAEERVALGLIIAEVIRRQGIAATPERVRAMVEEAAQTYEQPAEVVKWHYAKPERLKDFEVLALEANVVDWALSQAKLVEESVSFEALMNPQPAAPVEA
jgi:trigger factor